MRTYTTCILVLIHLLATGQVISFHDDSLKINKTYIDAHTTAKQLDKLLGAKHSTVKMKSDLNINKHTGIKVKQVAYYYPSLGLAFRTYKDDPLKYSFSIKLSDASDGSNEFDGKLDKPFSGYLFVVSNVMTGHKTVEDIKLMKDVVVSFQKSYFGGKKTILGGEILYQKDIIRLSVDKKTQEVTALYFYHNFMR